jgi:hypothetical protein
MTCYCARSSSWQIDSDSIISCHAARTRGSEVPSSVLALTRRPAAIIQRASLTGTFMTVTLAAQTMDAALTVAVPPRAARARKNVLLTATTHDKAYSLSMFDVIGRSLDLPSADDKRYYQ